MPPAAVGSAAAEVANAVGAIDPPTRSLLPLPLLFVRLALPSSSCGVSGASPGALFTK
jgi:hypothetical protein